MRTENRKSPGEGRGERDLQWGPLVAVFGAQRKLGRTSISTHRVDLQVSSVQSLQKTKQHFD